MFFAPEGTRPRRTGPRITLAVVAAFVTLFAARELLADRRSVGLLVTGVEGGRRCLAVRHLGHAAEPVANGSILSDSSMRLLHYHFLGLDYMLPRYEEKGRRLGAMNRANGWGYHYLWTPARIKEEYEQARAGAEMLTF